MVEITMPGWFRKSLYGTFALAWCSGVCFFVLKTWFVIDGEFGPEKHPWQYSALQIHGATAFLMMITVGVMVGGHVQHAWKLNRHRKRGVTILALVGSLIISAYLLYYIAQDESREIVELVHLTIGFSLPIALILHVWKTGAQTTTAIDPTNKRRL